jgi:hypothetical protein
MLSSLVVIPVHRFMPDALAAILRKAPLTPEKVAFAWRAAVGPAVDKVTTIELQGKVLHVRTKDAAWQREVERSMGIVRSRMETLLGKGVVGDIRVTAG